MVASLNAACAAIQNGLRECSGPLFCLVFSVILPKGTIYTLNFKTLHWFEAQ